MQHGLYTRPYNQLICVILHQNRYVSMGNLMSTTDYKIMKSEAETEVQERYFLRIFPHSKLVLWPKIDKTVCTLHRCDCTCFIPAHAGIVTRGHRHGPDTPARRLWTVLGVDRLG